MRTSFGFALAACAIGAAAAAATVVRRATPARAQEQALLYVSGMRIDGTRPIARVRLTNVSRDDFDWYTVHYTVRHTAAGAALSQPGFSRELRPGRTIEIDLGSEVQRWRNQAGVGPFSGPVQFVAYGESLGPDPFGPDTVLVEAVQTEGKATYDAVVQWQSQ